MVNAADALKLLFAVCFAAALQAITRTAEAQPDGARNRGGADVAIVGTWSGQAPGTGGMNQISDDYEPDGSFTSVMQLPNGSTTRMWGRYQLLPGQQGQARIDFAIQRWLPQEICTQVPGLQLRCTAYQMPRSLTAWLQFTSLASFQVNGVTMSRDPSPQLLQVQVPERYVQNAPAPFQPNIPQPVMPGIRPPISPYPGGGGGSNTGARCDDNHQRELCNMNNGTFIQSNGCLVCVAP